MAPTSPIQKSLFPAIDANYSGTLATSTHHNLYYEESGNPQGLPVLCIHGGPGSASAPVHRRFFDPAIYRICQLDQRGCGRSEPYGDTRQNTTADLIADMELLRAHLGIKSWLLFAGSWGAALALLYAARHSDACTGLILRGSFMASRSDLQWFFETASALRPEEWSAFTGCVGEQQQDDILEAFHQQLRSEDSVMAKKAAAAWMFWENTLDNPVQRENNNAPGSHNFPTASERDVLKYQLQTEYLRHKCYVEEGAVATAAQQLGSLPVALFHGRLDWVCRPKNAWQLHKMIDGSVLVWVEQSGHNPFSTAMSGALTTATACFAKDGNFQQLAREVSQIE
ncbi:MAG: prolyl aminopeptidase [Granulosicoccus sp.]|nr:prolyl aminopeptidase [Granulosicoccus sp.]